MSWFMFDVETNGPYPPKYSMLSVGCVLIDKDLDKTFYAEIAPISPFIIPDALNVSGFTHEETLTFEHPESAISRLEDFIIYNNKNGYPKFMSDSYFDWTFINHYLWQFLDRNIFGHGGTNINSLYKGMERNMFKSFKHLRKTKHIHNALDDAMGNAEAVLAMKGMGLAINIL